MSVDEALDFFTHHQMKKIAKQIQALADVGMGYIALGQSSSTLSGGKQRIKLASYLTKGNSKERFCFSSMSQQQVFISTILESCCILPSTHRSRAYHYRD